MARTPLLRQLLSLARDVGESERRGVSVAHLREERAARLDRRRFLQGAGALGAGVALAAGPFGRGRVAAASGAAPRIGIVGAGISGLVAALTLQDLGFSPVVFEAASRVGGRMHSEQTFWANGQVSEWCGEFIDTDNVTIRSLAKRLGLALVDHVAAVPPDAQPTYYFNQAYYLASQAALDFQPVYQTLQQQLTAIGSTTIYNHYTPTGYALDHLSIYDWIERYVPGGHTSALGQLLDVAYLGEYGLETSRQSSLNLIYLLAYQPDSTGLSLFGSSDQRFSIAGGNEQLPRAIAAKLPPESLHLSCSLTSIAQSSDGTVTLAFSTANGPRQQTFDAVILTLPFSVLRGLDYQRAGFDALKQVAITDLGYGTNSKLVLQFDARYWQSPGPWPQPTDGYTYAKSLQNSWDTSAGQPGPTGIITDFTGGIAGAAYQPTGPYTTSQDSPQVAAYALDFLRQLDQLWPGAMRHYNGRACLSYPTGDPHQLGSYSCWLTGQYTQFAGYERARQGNVYFAGEHTSVSFQGYMEGGARTGLWAAQVLAKQLGIAVTSPTAQKVPISN